MKTPLLAGLACGLIAASAASASSSLGPAYNGSYAGSFDIRNFANVTVSNFTSDNDWNIEITFEQDIDYTFGFPNANAFNLDLAEIVGKESGSAVHVYAIGWDTTHTAFAPSWLSEMRLEFTDKDITTGVGLTPSGTGGPGGPENNSSPKVDLIDLDLDFMLADGHLLLTVWDTFDDFGGGPEGTLFAGSSVSLAIKAFGDPLPAPGAMALLGLAGLVGTSRRRK